MKTWSKQLAAGDEVSHHDVNLWFNRGTLLRFTKGARGGDCIVRWQSREGRIDSEECSASLVSWRERTDR
jgi:hypothetical protein